VLDAEALLSRNPDVVAVDDLAGLTTTGRLVGHVLPRIRAAGINVIGTVHLSDLHSAVGLMGTLLSRPANRPILDDSSVDAADEVELVDVPPAELEERLRQGEIMSPGEAIKALQGEFRPEVLTALREMALRRVAEHCDRRLVAYMSTARINEPWEARPRVLVLVPSRRGQDAVIRRAAAHAARRDDAMTAVSVRRHSRSEHEKRLLGRGVRDHRRPGRGRHRRRLRPRAPDHRDPGDAERPQQQLKDAAAPHPADGRRRRPRRRWERLTYRELTPRGG
jgi:two-component system sensor histidine kinase KdpD